MSISFKLDRTAAVFAERMEGGFPFLDKAIFQGLYLTEKNGLSYHNLDHLRHALDAIQHVWYPDTNIPMPLVLAVAWHDAVYFPGADDGVNERLSAMLMYRYLQYRRKDKGIAATDALINDWNIASSIVNHTKISIHLDDGKTNFGGTAWLANLTNIMLDADLASMGTNDFNEFFETQAKIIAERYDVLADLRRGDCDTLCKNSRAFFGKLLSSREHIYRTEKARQIYEYHAQANIEAYLELVVRSPENFAQRLIAYYRKHNLA